MELKDHVNKVASGSFVEREFAFPRSVYSSKYVPENLKIMDRKSYNYIDSIVDWILN